MKIHSEALRDALNADPEFRIHARYWTTQFRLSSESQTLLIKLADGEVIEVDEGVTPFDSWSFQLAGTDDQWKALLAEETVPFFQDYYCAMLHHGFKIEGDMRLIWAYYPAITRTRAVIAQVVRENKLVSA